ncbi:MAG: Rnf-Nqr domain containing protein [Pseudomonadota bacterium]
MSDIFLILIGTVLVNNLVLVHFLGATVFVGTSRSIEAAISVSAASALVLTLSSTVNYLLHKFVLLPLGIEYLRTVVYMLVIVILVPFSRSALRRHRPELYRTLDIYVLLIAINSAVLGGTLLNIRQVDSVVESLVFGLGAAGGFALTLVLFAAIRERVDAADVPLPFRGTAIVLVTAGLMSLAFMGFSGMARL